MSDKRRNIVFRFGIVYLMMSLMFIGVVAKIIHIQYFEKEKIMKMASKQKVSDITIKPKRGNIYAADGRLLASSIPTYNVYMDLRVEALHQKKGKLFYSKLDSLSRALAEFFGDKEAVEYKQMLLKGYRDSVAELRLYPKRISYAELKSLRELPLLNLGRNKSGLITKEFVKRVKPFGSLASRTIGDVYPEEDKGGRSGIEGSFNEFLLGKQGFSTRQKVANQYIETVEVEPVDGLDIYSTIDIELQDIAEKALRDTIADLGARSACVVLMEVKTGEVRAMVNLDLDTASHSYFEGANHALTDRSEPGSTFKIASLMAVLDEGTVEVDDRFDTGNGLFPIANRVMKDHNHAKGGYGTLRVDEIIHASSNVGTSKMVLKAFGEHPERYVEKLYEFGLNDLLPLQMKGVAKPWIKHPDKEKNLWSVTSLPWMSIGYETKIPPIYTLTFFNAIANNGVMVKPLFVRYIKKDSENLKIYEPEVLRSNFCKETTLKKVQDIMVGVIEGKYGTAKNVKSNIVSIAGKTGTAQISQGTLGYKAGQTRHNVSFCGYFPVENPQYSCIVLITAPNGLPSGGKMAGSVFKKIAERTMLLKTIATPRAMSEDTVYNFPRLPAVKAGNVKAIANVHRALALQAPQVSGKWMREMKEADAIVNPQEFKVQKGLIPDVKGMGARDAFYLLGSLGLDVVIQGRGKVIAQNPKAGSELKKGIKIELKLQ
jgi:cell division protein FtsI (penicillin-binding protein 3)